MTTQEEVYSSSNLSGNYLQVSPGLRKNKISDVEREESANNSDSASSLSSDVSSTRNPLKRSASSSSSTEQRSLPRFTCSLPEGSLAAPSARVPTSPVCSDFAAPKFPKALSRPNSPSNAGRLIPPRSRIANIRRESDCSVDSEVAHERYIKAAVQVSTGFEDFSLDDKAEDRKRTKSLTDPISITILTSAFQSSAASPTRAGDVASKQCYSPSTHQLVRGNISYSPSPSPTPASPKRSRIMRSMSPIVTRQISKRRYTGSGNASGFDSDSEGPSLSMKRQCTSLSKNMCGSPLVRDAPAFHSFPTMSDADKRPASPFSECSTTSSIQNCRPKFFTDPSALSNPLNSQNPVDSDESVMESDAALYTDAQKDDQSSTAFSSRAGTPIDDQFSDASRTADDVPVTTTPTGFIRAIQAASPRSLQAASPNPFSGRLPLPPSPLASQKLRDDFC